MKKTDADPENPKNGRPRARQLFNRFPNTGRRARKRSERCRLRLLKPFLAKLDGRENFAPSLGDAFAAIKLKPREPREMSPPVLGWEGCLLWVASANNLKTLSFKDGREENDQI